MGGLGTEKQKKMSYLEEYFEKVKIEINRYFSILKFYDIIYSKYDHCNMDINDIRRNYYKNNINIMRKKKKTKKVIGKVK